MNFWGSNVRKIVIYISTIFYFSVVGGFAQAQPKPPTQKELDAMEAAFKKLPTPEQEAELSKITDNYQKKYYPLHNEFEKLGSEIDKATDTSDFLLTRAHVQAAMMNHKKLRALYLEHFNDVAVWGHRSGRANCVRQAEKMRLYTMRVSDQWLVRVTALPLGTVQERAYAGLYVMQGGADDTFYPDPEPGDNRHWVATEIIGLYAVCGGGRGEYVPGTE